jgi:gamma-F420-2:alpha-L-glutamate ligase
MRGWLLYKKAERELSAEDHGINRLVEAGKQQGIVFEIYRPEQFDLLSSDEESNLVFIDKKRVALPQVVLPRTGAESSYLALATLRHLEYQDIPLCNSVKAILSVKDKMFMSQRMRAAGLPSPKTLLVKFPVEVDWVADEIGFPIVLKTLSGARGQGVFLCETIHQFRDIVGLLGLQYEKNGFIVQRFIRESYGRDLRVFVLNGEVLGCMQRISSDGFKANFSLGGRVESYPISPEIEQLALASARLFELEIAGIDLLFGKEGFTICEANSSPGFKGMEKASQTDIATQIVSYAMQKARV